MQKTERMPPAVLAPSRPTRVTELPHLPAHPKTSAETIEGHIMTALEILGKTEEELNQWVSRQFKWKGDWSDMSDDLKNKTYLTLQGKIDQQNAETEGGKHRGE